MPTTYWQRKLLALGTIFLGLIPLFTLGTRLAASAQDNVAATALDGGYGGTSPLLPPPQQPYSVTIGQAPTVTISSPANRATFIQGTVISFTGTVTDVEDGDLTANLAWLSSLDGGIGSGGSFTRTNLSVGAHIITATVTDSGGMTGTDSVSITIFADVPVLVGAGDIANDRDRDEATATLLDGIPGTVVTLGDNAYPDGAPDEFANYYHPTWGRHLARTRPATGNREYNTSNASGHFGYFGAAAGDPTKGYYSFDVHSWHIIVLNTECSEVGGCGPSSPQYLWLQADLAAHANLCTLAIMHKPVYSSKNASNAGDDFWTLFYFESVDVVLSGHAHFYERFAPQDSIGVADATHGVRQFVVGTGGTSLTSAGTAIANSEVLEKKTYGVLKLTLHPTSYAWQFVPIAGQTFTDSGTYP